jgi:hypothetical protein
MMAIEMKRVESAVNIAIGKALTWAGYGLLVAANSGVRWLARCAVWLR